VPGFFVLCISLNSYLYQCIDTFIWFLYQWVDVFIKMTMLLLYGFFETMY